MRTPCRLLEVGTGELFDQLCALGFGERLQENRGRVQLAPTPIGTEIEQVGPGEADQQDRYVSRPVGEMLDQVEERGLTPMDVVEDNDDRFRAGERLEQRLYGSESFFGAQRDLGKADHFRDTLSDELRVLLVSEGADELRPGRRGGIGVVEPYQLLDRFHHRPEGDALAVGEAAPARDGGSAHDVVEEFVDEP